MIYKYIYHTFVPGLGRCYVFLRMYDAFSHGVPCAVTRLLRWMTIGLEPGAYMSVWTHFVQHKTTWGHPMNVSFIYVRTNLTWMNILQILIFTVESTLRFKIWEEWMGGGGVHETLLSRPSHKIILHIQLYLSLWHEVIWI